MDDLTLRKAQALAKKLYVYLTEVQDISRQLAQALDRNDQVTARMLIGMRREPLDSAQRIKQALGALRGDLEAQDVLRFTELLNGAEEGETEQERLLVIQLKSNELLLRQVLELDESLNRKVAREKSIYQ